MTWPLFKPPQDNTSWTWREHVFTDAELDRIVAQGEDQGMADATVGAGAVNTYRSSHISWLPTDDPEYDWIYSTLAPIIQILILISLIYCLFSLPVMMQRQTGTTAHTLIWENRHLIGN